VPDEWVAEPEMAADPAASGAVAGVTQADWLANVCPYLTSEDGTYGSSQPDDGHRCTAQDPAGAPPPAFQERFCLTERHVRCELYKYVQETHAAAAVGAPVADGDEVQPARSSSVPAAMGPALGGKGTRRPAIFVAAGLGGAALIVFVAVLLLGGSDDPAAPSGGSPSPSAELAQTPQPTPRTTPEPTAEPTPAPESTPAPDTTPGVTTEPTAALLIRYEVQEGEALIKIGKAFGTSRTAILEANEGMQDLSPFVATGDVIVVPVSTEMTPEELEGVPGFVAYVE
jgi:LysM repeat protein